MVEPGGSEEYYQQFLRSKQCTARCCSRCRGLLVDEWCYNLESDGTYRIATLRCVQCGHRIDPLILQNQSLRSVRQQPEPIENPLELDSAA